jgi:hypothetical protein
MYDDLKNIRKDNKAIRDFGILIGFILLIIAGILFYKERESYELIILLGIAFIGLGLGMPIFLKPFYLIWMVFAVILGWFMSRLILVILFYFILTPIGLVGKLFGQNFLGNNFNSSAKSYWNLIDSKSEINQDYEKQF